MPLRLFLFYVIVALQVMLATNKPHPAKDLRGDYIIMDHLPERLHALALVVHPFGEFGYR